MRRQGFGIATTAGDPDSPPSSAPCSQCGDRVDPTWYEPHPRHNRAGWWLPPQPVCPSCVQRVDAQEAADRLDRLQQRSGVPWRYRRYSWGDKVLEHAGEPWHQFRARVQATGRATVGVSRANVDAFRAFRDWRPRGMRSLYLEGTVGTGKTLFASCLARELLAEPLRLAPVPDEDLAPKWRRAMAAGYRRPVGKWGGWSVCFVQEADLQRDLRNWYTRLRQDPGAPSPMKRAKEAQVLILDDLGTADQEAKNWKQQIEGLIDARYVAGLPVVITSNLRWEDLGNHYGSERLASRLAEMVGDRHYALDPAFMSDWRREAGAGAPSQTPTAP